MMQFTNKILCIFSLAYLTYNPASEGDYNKLYYQKKLEIWRQGTGGSISINDDFDGHII
jgi:hypothetical protein